MFSLLLFHCWNSKFIPRKPPKRSCHAFVLCCDPFYLLPRFRRRQAGSKSSNSLKCRSALVLDGTGQLFLSPVLPPALLGGSWTDLNVIDEGVIRNLSVSLLWCQRDEGEIKRSWRFGFSSVSLQRYSTFVFCSPYAVREPVSKKMGTKSIKVTVSLFAF